MKRSTIRRAGPDPAYDEFRRQILERDDWACRFWDYTDPSPSVPLACGGGLEVHHIVNRRAWPAGRMRADNTVTLCGLSHHAWVTANPAAAEAIGLHKRYSTNLDAPREAL